MEIREEQSQKPTEIGPFDTFPHIEREKISHRDGSYDLAPLSTEDRNVIFDATQALADKPLTHLSAAVAPSVGLIKTRLVWQDSLRAIDTIKDLLLERIVILCKYSRALDEQQKRDTSNFDELVRKPNGVQLAPRKENFYFGGVGINGYAEVEPYTFGPAFNYERWFDHAARPWAERRTLETLSDDDLDLTCIEMHLWKRFNQGFTQGSWLPPLFGLAIEAGRYWSLQSESLLMLGHTGIIEPLPGLRVLNSAGNQLVSYEGESAGLFKRRGGVFIDTREIPQMQGFFQKVFPVVLQEPERSDFY